jgi:hypothetical protein
MGKRSNFARVPQEKYRTPRAAVVPLLRHLEPGTWFAEPCAGDGCLVSHLVRAGHHCPYAADLSPDDPGVARRDALDGYLASQADVYDVIITNPPWRRDQLHPMIAAFTAICPTWLLFDADWMHTAQAAPFLPMCAKIVTVGRVKWIPGSRDIGKDNCCWYLFDAEHSTGPQFCGVGQ